MTAPVDQPEHMQERCDITSTIDNFLDDRVGCVRGVEYGFDGSPLALNTSNEKVLKQAGGTQMKYNSSKISR